MRKSARGMVIASAAVLATSTALMLAPPASASSTHCSITSPSTSCQTGTLGASSGHWIKLRVNVPLYGTVTCRVHDAANGVTVGTASRKSSLPSWAYTEITINGLYGSYFAVCINSSKTGRGTIRNS
ncbi:hypothetical protein [Nonomuraea sp. NPDC048826]|uniref:hypothetical protein n=1 Tax=Nonomuraea sp. NPDC048826 TaxID=3364347 RepID=UPI003720635C